VAGIFAYVEENNIVYEKRSPQRFKGNVYLNGIIVPGCVILISDVVHKTLPKTVYWPKLTEGTALFILCYTHGIASFSFLDNRSLKNCFIAL